MFIIFFILILLEEINLNPDCKQGKNFCQKCNPVTKLCSKCESEIFITNENGGYIGAKKCIFGRNYCNECTDDNILCKTCENGFFPDENGGCSYTDNCVISYQGKCLKYVEDYILIGSKNSLITICKSLNSEDLKNCEKVNLEKGFCEQCLEGYF